MIRNHEGIKNKYECGKSMAHYLQTHGVPLFSIEGSRYYFVDNENLRKTLKDAPLWIKIIGVFR